MTKSQQPKVSMHAGGRDDEVVVVDQGRHLVAEQDKLRLHGIADRVGVAAELPAAPSVRAQRWPGP